MRHHIVIRYVGFVLLFNAAFMFISSIISFYYHDEAFLPLLYSSLVTALFGIFPFIFVPPTFQINNDEGLMIVVASWLVSCVAGSMPYLLFGGEFSLANAWFESVSGYTTTGSTILTSIETLPRGILFWRSATHWIGGMGIIIFVLSVLPTSGNVGMILYRTEASSLAQENFRHRARRAVRILMIVYAGLTLFEALALMLCGLGIFDAVTHAFATIATGGFSPRNEGIAYFQSAAVETVIIVFMILSGMHFGLLFAVLSGRLSNLWKSSVLRYYLTALALGTLITTISMKGELFSSWSTSFRHAAFQIISAGTSTGFSTMNTSFMPALAQLVFIFFALQCACAGSTSGGIKTDRVLLLGKVFRKQIKQLLHPSAVIPISIDGTRVKSRVIEMNILFISIYLVVVFAATLLLTSMDVDILSAFSGSVAVIGNVGPGLGMVGSMDNFQSIPVPGKFVFTMLMLIGRLEIFAFLAFFIPRQWR